MKRSGKMLRISEDRTIFILENEDGSYINVEGEISYKNVGKNFDIACVNTAFTHIDEYNMLNILDGVGKPIILFPALWLDTTSMQIQNLVEKGVLKMQNA